LILRGLAKGSASQSTYTFVKEIIGFDLATFFERHAVVLKTEITSVLETLLSPHDAD
jgi:hypothetical protein